MKTALLLTLISAGAIGLPALADVYRVVAPTGATKVYKTGQTPLADLTSQVSNGAKPKVLRINNCGYAKFKDSATSPIVSFAVQGGSAQIVPPGVPKAEPVCTKNPAIAGQPPTYSATNDDPVGTLRRASDGYIYYKAATTGPNAITADIAKLSTKKSKVNQCGVAAFSFPVGTDPSTQISVGGEPMVDIIQIAARPIAQKCAKVNGTYVLFNAEPPPIAN